MLRLPTEEDARALLDGAGIHYRDCGGYFLFKCPFHADKNPSAVLYKDNYAFKCFAGCGGMSWRKFYHKIRGVEWNENGSFSLSLRPCEVLCLSRSGSILQLLMAGLYRFMTMHGLLNIAGAGA